MVLPGPDIVFDDFPDAIPDAWCGLVEDLSVQYAKSSLMLWVSPVPRKSSRWSHIGKYGDIWRLTV